MLPQLSHSCSVPIVCIGLISNKMVCHKDIYVNLAKRCYCNAGVCVYVCVFTALCHTMTSLNVGRLLPNLWRYHTIAYLTSVAYAYEKYH